MSKIVKEAEKQIEEELKEARVKRAKNLIREIKSTEEKLKVLKKELAEVDSYAPDTSSTSSGIDCGGYSYSTINNSTLTYC